MHWAVAAPFVRDATTDRWLVPFVPGDRHRFTLIPAPPERSWHGRRRRTAGLREWTDALVQGRRAWRESEGGIVTVFPHLAVTCGLNQRLGFSRHKPIIAWCFNLGELYGGLKQRAACAALAGVDRFVVHSRAEVRRYADWLGFPTSRFEFVPLQIAPIAISEQEDRDRPFVLAMGSAKRDYATFFAAMRQSGHPTIVVAASQAVAGLEIPPNVEVRTGLTPEACRALAQRARVNVVPVLNNQTASGQVTIIEAMRMGRVVVATRCVGSEDYIEHDVTGVLVEPRAPGALRAAIDRLWDDAPLRARLASAAERWVERNCSDEAAGRSFERVLSDVEAAAKRQHDL